MNENGFIHLKTDNVRFFDYSINAVENFNGSIVEVNRNIYNNPGELPGVVTRIKTYYEEMFVSEGKPICYMKFRV